MKRLLFLLALFMAVPAFAGEPTNYVGSTAYEGSHVLKTKGGALYNLAVSYHTAAYRTLMLFDGTTVPSNGSTTACTSTHATGCLLWCFEGDAQSTNPTESFGTKTWSLEPLTFVNGLVVVASTSTSGCSSLTADGSNEWFNAQIDTY